MKNKILSILISILLFITFTSCDDKTMNQIRALKETIATLENYKKVLVGKYDALKEKYHVEIEKFENFIQELKAKHAEEIKNIKIEYEEKLKTTSKKYNKLMTERNLLEKTIKKLKEENTKLKNRGSRVDREMFL